MSAERPGKRRGALRSFLFGGVIGGAIAVAAPRVRRGRAQREGPEPVVGLEAFEGAPCWEYDRREAAADGSEQRGQ
ncbi:MAG: hypothetical protein ACXVYV_00060 [Gaiellales bacterium]